MMRANKMCVEKDLQIACDDIDKKKNLISKLDCYSLSKIFMLLPIAERIVMEEVSHQWKEACQLAWHDIKKYKCNLSIGRSYDNCLLTSSYVEKILLNCGVYLKELSLSHVCNSSIMSIVADQCKNLTILECEFREESLAQENDRLVQAFTKLEKLKIIKIHMNNNHYDRIINLFGIINSLPEEIEEIHLFTKTQSSNFIKKLYNFTLRKFNNLQKLTLHGNCVDNIIQEVAEKTKLVYLDIHLLDLPEDFFPFNQLVNLEHIKISPGIIGETKNLTTDILDSILRTYKRLKYLDLPFGLYDVAGIPTESWANCENLEHLGINFCKMTVELETTFTTYCKNLKYLRLELTSRMISKKLTELQNLECLILPGYMTLSDETIIAFSNNCKKLKHLQIPCCNLVQSVDGKPSPSTSVLEELSKLQYLEHLNLEDMHLEDSTIIAIAKNCKYLKYLNISYCLTITEAGLNALTELENLQELNVNLVDITDDIISKFKSLKKLHCFGCDKLTDAGIIKFINNNPDLEVLDICCIENITFDIVVAADQTTRNRVNGVILYIYLSDDIMEDSKLKIRSQWLVFKQAID